MTPLLCSMRNLRMDCRLYHPWPAWLALLSFLGSHHLASNSHRQYLETLYVSRTSLAYFAKGVLGRMRNSFSEDMTIASDFYRSYVLPLKKFDLKYKTTINEMCQNLSVTRASARSKKKSAAPKVAKNGLYTDEKDFVIKWWDSRPHHATNSASLSSQKAQVHAAIAELRIREAMMQILLILEVSQTDLVAKQAPSRTNTGRNDSGRTPFVDHGFYAKAASRPQS